MLHTVGKSVRDIVTTELELLLEQGNLSPEDEDHILACLEKAYGHVNEIRARSRVGIRAWLGKILLHVKADSANKNGRHPEDVSLTDLIEVGGEPATLDTDPATVVVRNERTQHALNVHTALREVLDKLDFPTACLFRSRFYHRIPFADIAVGLHISEDAAVMRYQRLRKRVFHEVQTLLQCSSPETIDFFAPDS